MKEMAGETHFRRAKIRGAPSPHRAARGDLFSAGLSAGICRITSTTHAQPAPPQQIFGYFNYSMPFPALSEYHCALALFNPMKTNRTAWSGRWTGWGDDRAASLQCGRTERAHTVADLKAAATPGEALAITPLSQPKLQDGGVVVVRNESEKASFAYTFIKGREGRSFTVEHPLHFASDAPLKAARTTPYGANRSFPAQALLYTPILFRGARVGGVQLESRFYLSSSRWQEKALWLFPFATSGEGQIAWASNHDDGFQKRVLPEGLTDQGLVRLTEFQSCRIDARGLPLPDGFSGGFGVGAIPKTSHSLLKVEVRAAEWGRVAFTHFRPGGPAAKAYRQVDDRGSLASDYIVSGAHVMGSAANRKRDCLLAVMNIEFEDENTGTPKLQLFGPSGLVGEKQLPDFPALACRHMLLSELFPGVQSDPGHPFTAHAANDDDRSGAAPDYERRSGAEHGRTGLDAQDSSARIRWGPR